MQNTNNRASRFCNALLTAAIFLSFFLVGCCRPEAVAEGSAKSVYPVMPPRPKLGILTVEASISDGTRFRVYTNDVWQHLMTVPVVPGEWQAYRFEIPASLKTLRLDFSESPDAVIAVRKIRIELPGDTPRALDLDSLRQWVMYHCKVDFNTADQTATIHATDREMYMMSNVWVNRMRVD